jgi:hypothetical protein
MTQDSKDVVMHMDRIKTSMEIKIPTNLWNWINCESTMSKSDEYIHKMNSNQHMSIMVYGLGLKFKVFII